MMSSRAVIFACLCMALMAGGASAASRSATATKGAKGTGLRSDAPVIRRSLLADDEAAPAAEDAAEDAVPAVKKGFVAIYYGLLVSFAIFFTALLFLYFFQYGYAGDYYFFAYSYMVLVFIIASGLSDYFTSSILTALIAMGLLMTILFGGFGAMMTISTPDRFEGDKSNMGRTRLEGSYAQ
mmetsp:Transcript_8554/g.21267  ORF Transcript_8554/g.21267 Transcript_8554/m.21267 type:complete len:182 (-) Transcript_8554:64-609(-)